MHSAFVFEKKNYPFIKPDPFYLNFESLNIQNHIIFFEKISSPTIHIEDNA